MNMHESKSGSAKDLSVDDLLSQVNSLRDEIGSLSRQFVRYVDQEGDSMSRAARQAIADLNQQLQSYGVDTDALTKSIRTKSDEVRKAARNEIRRHPLRSLAVTVGLGLIIGAMVRGK